MCRVTIIPTQQPTSIKKKRAFHRDLASYIQAYLRLFPLTAGRAPTEGPYRHQLRDS